MSVRNNRGHWGLLWGFEEILYLEQYPRSLWQILTLTIGIWDGQNYCLGFAKLRYPVPCFHLIITRLLNDPSDSNPHIQNTFLRNYFNVNFASQMLIFLHIFRLHFLYMFQFLALPVTFTSAFIPPNFLTFILLSEVLTNKDPDRLRPNSS